MLLGALYFDIMQFAYASTHYISSQSPTN